MDFAEATEQPITITLDGQPVTFPVLTIDDYLPWSSELHEQRRKHGRALIPATADDLTKLKMLRMIDYEEPALEDIASMVYTARGARRVLFTSLKRAGKSDEEANAVLSKLPARNLARLAVEVSALFEKRPKANGTPQPAATANPSEAAPPQLRPDAAQNLPAIGSPNAS